MATHKIRVVVPQREGYPGVFAVGRLWTPEGNDTEVEVDDAQLQALAARPGIVVLQDGKPVKAAQAPASRIGQVALSADEIAMVEEYRAHRARDPNIARKYGVGGQHQGALMQPTGESTEDATNRALAESAAGGQSAQAPLDHRDILMGQQTGGTATGGGRESTKGEQKPRSNEDLKPKK